MAFLETHTSFSNEEEKWKSNLGWYFTLHAPTDYHYLLVYLFIWLCTNGVWCNILKPEWGGWGLGSTMQSSRRDNNGEAISREVLVNACSCFTVFQGSCFWGRPQFRCREGRPLF